MRRTGRTLLGILMVLVSTAGLSAASHDGFGLGIDTSDLRLTTDNLDVLDIVSLTLGGGSGNLLGPETFEAPVGLAAEIEAFAGYNTTSLLKAERERYDTLDAAKAELQGIDAQCVAERQAIDANARSNASYSREMARADISSLDAQCRLAKNVLQNTVRSLERSSYRVNIRDPVVDQHREILRERSRVANELARAQSTCDAQVARIESRVGVTTDEARAARAQSDLESLQAQCAAQTARIQNQVDAYTTALDNIESTDIDARYANAILGAAQGYRLPEGYAYGGGSTYGGSDFIDSGFGSRGGSGFFGRGGFFDR